MKIWNVMMWKLHIDLAVLHDIWWLIAPMVILLFIASVLERQRKRR